MVPLARTPTHLRVSRFGTAREARLRNLGILLSLAAHWGHRRLPSPVVPLSMFFIIMLGAPERAGAQTDCVPLPGSGFHRTSGSQLPPKLNVTLTTAFPESLDLIQTATLGRTGYGDMCFGDTDHDGRGEVALADKIAGVLYFHLFESQGGTVYSDEYLGEYLIPYALCDLDRDGKGEVMGQRGYQVKVYESVDAHSYPTQLVWVSKNLTNVVGWATVGDTDLDGRMEIIQSASTFGSLGYLYFFENTGDNSFAQVCSLQVTTGAMGKKAIGDLDLDGIPEIAFGTIDGGMYVVKSSGNDTWRIQWQTQTDLIGAYGACVGPDMDGNGKPELFVAGCHQGWKTIVFESSGPDEYAPVATFKQSDGWSGGGDNAVGNFTGSGRYEYAMQGFRAIWFYGATDPGQWDLTLIRQNFEAEKATPRSRSRLFA
jgi:hypothetical protein